MFDRLRHSFVPLLVLLFTAWAGYKSYRYFTHNQKPDIDLLGIVADGSYARTMEGVLNAHNGYKIDTVSIYIDDKLAWEKRIKAAEFQEPVSIQTAGISDGEHTLKIKAYDSSYNKNSCETSYQITIDNAPLKVSLLTDSLTVFQGKTAMIKFAANKPLASAEATFMRNTYSCCPETEGSLVYQAFLPVDCEAQEGLYTATLALQDNVSNKQQLSCPITIKNFEFKKQRGFAIDSEKFSHEKEISLSAQAFAQAIEKTSLDSPKKKLWVGKFELPIDSQRMTTPFGEIRVTPERGRYMHRGIDLINRPKCVVWASQNGKIVIKDRFEITGNTIVIDHGLGVQTVYAHLEDYADVEVGAMIKKGSPVGRLGMTGYASGYHLHWELRVNGVAVDPLEWTESIY